MSQKTDSMIKLALVFFVSLLSFSIGTYVGKKYSDNQHKLSLLEPKKPIPTTAKAEEFASDVMPADATHDMGGEEAAPATTAGEYEAIIPSDKKPAALTDAEVAKIAEEFASEEQEIEEKIVSTIDPQEKDLKTISNDTPAATRTVKIPTHHAATNPAGAVTAATHTASAAHSSPSAHETLAQKTEARTPASIPPKKEMTPLLFTIQIGSYPTQTEAEKLTLDLQNKGYKTSFVPANINGQTWFRVNVGLFGSVKEAQDYKKEFLEKTKLSSAIVQRVLQ